MIYIVKKNTKTHKAIDALFAKADKIAQGIKNFMNKYKTGSKYYKPHGAWFGIDAVLFDGSSPADKKQFKAKKIDGHDAWIPRAGSQAEKDLKAIPVVNTSDLAALLKYDLQSGPPSGRGHGHLCSLCPGFEVVGGTYVVTTEDWVEWRPGKDMTEITMSEFEKMTAKAKNKKKK